MILFSHKLSATGFVLLLIALFVACREPGTHHKAPAKQVKANNAYLSALKRNKDDIDRIKMDSNKLTVLVKVPGSDSLQWVKNGKFPDEVETTYNLLKDKTGNIVYILESPTSESGDWDIDYKSYFDSKGHLFAFERSAGFFNEECTDGSANPAEPVHEKLIKFFDTRSKPIDSVYTLVDQDKKPLNKSKCVSNYDFPYRIIFNLKSYLKANKIKNL